MFIEFFYRLKHAGIPVNPTAFLLLHRALSNGLICSLKDFYISARTILVKRECHFDIYDRVFAAHFEGAAPEIRTPEISEAVRALLAEWLETPAALAEALNIDRDDLPELTPEALLAYFEERLNEQTERHDGGAKWIGTVGTSPVGNAGFFPAGMRIGGVSVHQSAVKVAMDRRYKDYAATGPLTQTMMTEALKRLRNWVPAGPKDRLNIDETINRTTQNGGEIDLVFDRRIQDRLEVILCIDNGGWSMDPYVPLVQRLFNHARAMFKTLHTFFFHNTVYEHLWEDAARSRKPFKIDGFTGFDPETRLIIVGDAAMAPYELMAPDGSIHLEERSGRPSIECLRWLAKTFSHAVWLNPSPRRMWDYTYTTRSIKEIFPMFELTLEGLEAAISRLAG